MTDLLALTEQLCAVPSVSGDERALADLVEARLRECAAGLEIERVGENVVARTQRGAATRILLGGHLDRPTGVAQDVPQEEHEDAGRERVQESLHHLGQPVHARDREAEKDGGARDGP